MATSAPNMMVDFDATSSSLLLLFTFQNGCMIKLRPSGTEDKLKYYSEMRGVQDEQEGHQQLEAIVESLGAFIEDVRAKL